MIEIGNTPMKFWNGYCCGFCGCTFQGALCQMNMKGGTQKQGGHKNELHSCDFLKALMGKTESPDNQLS